MKQFNGLFAASALPKNVRIKNPFGTRELTQRILLDVYKDVTVMQLISEKEADEETGAHRSVTIQIAVAGPQQLRRITGFDEMGDKLKALVPGTVISVAGTPLYARNNNQIGVQNASLNGMNVTDLKIEFVPEVKQEVVQNAESVDTQQNEHNTEELLATSNS